MQHLLTGLTLAAMSLGLGACTNVAAPEPIYPIPTQAQVNWQRLETYAFVHYGLNTYNDMEWGFGDTPATTFRPTDLDVDQWMRTLKSAGMKGILLPIKHHDGFCLWDTKYSDYSVKNTGLAEQIDILKEVIAGCKKYDMKLGVYISPWDRNHASYGDAEYVEYFHNQIAEVVNEYCDGVDLFEFWFDGANGGDGYYGGKRDVRRINASQYYNYQAAKDIIHNKFPNTMIFGGTVPTIRWIGNESGWAGHTNWAMWSADQPERVAMAYGDKNSSHWLPGEVDVSIRPGWFYHKREDHQLRSLGTIVDYYYQSVGRNANLLLNIPVNHEGKIGYADSVRVVEWKNVIDKHFENNLATMASISADKCRGRGYEPKSAIDGNWDSYWATPDGESTGALTLNFKTLQELNTLMLQEYIPLGQRVESFDVKYKDETGKYIPIQTTDTMSTIGYKRLIRFDNIKTDELVISFNESRGVPCINSVGVYLAAAVLDEPKVTRNAENNVSIKAAKGTEIYYTTDGSDVSLNSKKYEGPFSFPTKGAIKAMAYDPTTQKCSDMANCFFDIPSSLFSIVSPTVDKADRRAFDGNTLNSYYISAGENSVTFSLGGDHMIRGIKYTPDQSRWGRGPIHRYRIFVDNKMVKEGEFSNIKQNPITQIVEFPAVKGSKITLEALSIADGTSRASISDFSVITI
ncbi:MAG: alpha-L-fucosidase [Marinifilaceae bacterium]